MSNFFKRIIGLALIVFMFAVAIITENITRNFLAICIQLIIFFFLVLVAIFATDLLFSDDTAKKKKEKPPETIKDELS